MRIGKDHLYPCRVLNEDDDFITLEVAKRAAATFTLQRDESNQVGGGDRFLTILFATVKDRRAVIWKPWADNAP